MNQLKSKEQEITAQVRQKEAQRKKMQQAILTIIRRETLEAEKKEKDRLAKLKANNDNTKAKPSSEIKTGTAGGAKVSAGEGGLKSTTDNRPYSALETTEEGRETSVSFETNRGNLPWPSDKGYVYIHFGVENIPGTKLNNNKYLA